MASPPVHVHLNAAVSLDGRTALPDGQPIQLSGPEDHARVHALRASVDAILVGIGTVLTDDPRLTARPGGDPAARQPLRVILDSRGRTPPDACVLDGTAPTLLLTGEGAKPPEGVDHLPCGGDRVHLPRALEALGDRGVERLLVEGGSRVAGSFLAEDLVDRLTLYVAPVIVGGEGPTLAAAPGAPREEAVRHLRQVSVERLGEGALLTYERPGDAP